uniref:Uncharacterized protein n=1 Tax=Schistosoma japonicum TaxID=6182 RepID=Q5C2L1_SCHJA|nr:unknown [Schistosoma japonicum]
MIPRIPDLRHLAILSNTSIRGESNIPTTPTNVKFCSYFTNLVESSKSICALFTGASHVAKAKHLSVSRPVPYDATCFTISDFSGGVIGTFLLPTRTNVHRSNTPSGAPLTNILGAVSPEPAVFGTLDTYAGLACT